MGKVFTPEEIKADRIPRQGAHYSAAKELLETLYDRYINSDNMPFEPSANGMDSAMVFGSVTQGRPTLRSDIDVLIAYFIDGGQPSAMVEGYQNVFRKIEDKWHTPVEGQAWHTEELRAGWHNIDPIFLTHLQTVKPEWRVGNPIANIDCAEVDWTAVLRRYATHKRSKFSRALADEQQPFDVKVLQRALELPSALGRKSLLTLVKADLIVDEGFAEAPKDKIIGTIRNMAQGYDHITRPLDNLIEFDSAYTGLLQSTIDGHTSVTGYEKELSRVYRPLLWSAIDYSSNLGNHVLAGIGRGEV